MKGQLRMKKKTISHQFGRWFTPMFARFAIPAVARCCLSAGVLGGAQTCTKKKLDLHIYIYIYIYEGDQNEERDALA